MGSHNRSCATDLMKPAEDAMTYPPQQLAVHLADDSIDQQTGSVENGISLLSFGDVVARPPVPPRLKPRNQEAAGNGWNVTASNSPPPPLVPPRAPVVCQPLGAPVPETARRPALEPRLKTETQLAGVHLHSKPLLTRSTPVPRSLLLSQTVSHESPLVIGSIVLPGPAPPQPQLNSRIILDGGRPTTVLDEPGLSDVEGARTSPAERVVRLSLWPIRSPSSNLRLDAISNLPKRTNDYVDAPTTLGPNVTSQSDHELTSFTTLQSPRVGVEGNVAPTQEKSKSGEVHAKSLKSENAACKDGVICSSCGRCRCRKCVERHELPRRWISEQECSAQSAIDWCSCMCVARALFYHCRASAEEDFDCSDDPCGGCEQPHCCARWTAVGLLSVCLPCLCCYWPLNCLRHACTAGYNVCCRTQGCRCERDLRRLGSKGLLTESESSSF